MDKLKYYIIFKKDRVLVKNSKQEMIIPTSLTFDQSLLKEEESFVLQSDCEIEILLFDVEDTFIELQGFEFKGLRALHEHYKEDSFLMAIQGLHVLNWSRKNQYCGVCGTKFTSLKTDRSKSCPSCKNQLFPQTSMAVIVGIIKEGKLLLAHNFNFPEGLYSIIAGFVELGETLEGAVEREIFEEVGLKVKNIRYFGSQPWPFPNSLMIGFIADYESGEINTDDIEIEQADWFTPDTFPHIPSHFSIARQIIETYKESL